MRADYEKVIQKSVFLIVLIHFFPPTCPLTPPPHHHHHHHHHPAPKAPPPRIGVVLCILLTNHKTRWLCFLLLLPFKFVLVNFVIVSGLAEKKQKHYILTKHYSGSVCPYLPPPFPPITNHPRLLFQIDLLSLCATLDYGISC